MIDTPINHTLADLLEVYRVKVSALEQDVDRMEFDLDNTRSDKESAKRERDRARQDADRSHKLIQETEKQNAELAEKVTKLEGVIKSLHIELQTEREAHQAAKKSNEDAGQNGP